MQVKFSQKKSIEVVVSYLVKLLYQSNFAVHMLCMKPLQISVAQKSFDFIKAFSQLQSGVVSYVVPPSIKGRIVAENCSTLSTLWLSIYQRGNLKHSKKKKKKTDWNLILETTSASL